MEELGIGIEAGPAAEGFIGAQFLKADNPCCYRLFLWAASEKLSIPPTVNRDFPVSGL